MAYLETLTRQANTAGLLQQCQTLLELQVAEASKALLGSGLPAAQMHRAVLKTISALIPISCVGRTDVTIHRHKFCRVGAYTAATDSTLRTSTPKKIPSNMQKGACLHSGRHTGPDIPESLEGPARLRPDCPCPSLASSS